MSSSLDADYATIKVFSLSGSLQSRSNWAWKSPATSRNIASVPTDHPGLTFTLHRLRPPHPHLWSRFLLLDVSSDEYPRLYVLISDDLSLSQSAERDCQGIDGSHPCKRAWRFRNGSHVLYCWSVRIEASPLFQNTKVYLELYTHLRNMICIPPKLPPETTRTPTFLISHFAGTQSRVPVCPKHRTIS